MKFPVLSSLFSVGKRGLKHGPSRPAPLCPPRLKTENSKLPGRFPIAIPCLRTPALSLCLSLCLSSGFPACSTDEAPEEEAFVPNTGQIQVLNGCGKPGAAEHFRNFLADQGFDIIEFGNAASWNYSQTLVVARTDNLPVARDLARVMGTDNLIHLSDPLAMVDATVFVGKDYEELIKRWQKRKP